MGTAVRQGKWGMLPVAGLIALSLLAGSANASGGASISIVGGSKTTIQKWPWQVALAVSPERAPKKKPSQRFFCGGTLIAPTMIVTAAHCAVDIDLSKPEYFSVIAGRTHLNATGTGTEVLAKDAFFPTTRSGLPRYALLFEIRWDLALIELTEPVPMQPIKIAGPDETALIAPGQPAVKTGWGMTNPRKNDRISNVLMKGKTTIQPSKACAFLQDGGFLPAFDPDTQVCLGDIHTRTSPCNGDSGGPAVVPSSQGYRLFGATNYGLDIECSAELPSIDAALAQPDVRDWIADIVKDKTGVDPVGTGAIARPLPELCRVPRIEGIDFGMAKAKLRSSTCRVGKVKYVRIPRIKRLRHYDGKVMRSDPSPFWLKERGTKVNMLVAKWYPKKRDKRRG